MTRVSRILFVALAASSPTSSFAQELGGTTVEAAAEEPSRLSVVPFVAPAYQPETSFLVGGGAIFAWQPPPESEKRESQIMVSGVATWRRQFSGIVVPDIYLLDDRLELAGSFSAARFPDLFFGIGGETRAADAEAFTPIFLEADFTPRWRVLRHLYVGPSVRLHVADMARLTPGGVLESHDIAGASGGRIVQLGVTGSWDSRDNQLYPRRGSLIRTTFRQTAPQLGSQFRFTQMKTDARTYLHLPWADHVLALQAVGEWRNGAPPFYELGKLGGENGRGLYDGQFRERQLFSAQAEYRAHLFWRVGGVAFASAGTVAHDVAGLVQSKVHPAVGAGLRIAPSTEVPINIRLDAAFGTDLQFYLNIGEAF